jgi:hypothetical protein
MSNFNFSTPNLLLLLLTAALLALLLYPLGRALNRAVAGGAGRAYARGVWAVVLAYLVAATLLCALAAGGFFSAAEAIPPRGILILGLGLGSTAALASLSTKGRLRFLNFIPPQWLVLIQTYRIAVEVVLLLLYGENLIPKELTWEGRNFDVLIGLTALPVGYLLARRPERWRRAAVIWNAAGLVSLLNIFVLAAASFPSPFRVYALNHLPTYFPGILIGALVAPAAVYLHVLSLKQLSGRSAAGASLPEAG